jgi:hypothetical protein
LAKLGAARLADEEPPAVVVSTAPICRLLEDVVVELEATDRIERDVREDEVRTLGGKAGVNQARVKGLKTRVEHVEQQAVRFEG